MVPGLFFSSSLSFGFRRDLLKRCGSPESKSLMLRPLRLQHVSGLTVDQLQLSHLLPANAQTCVQYPEYFLHGSGNSETQSKATVGDPDWER